MKAPKLVLVLTAVLALAVIAAVGLALTPGVQGWAARRLVSGKSDLRVDFDRLAVGPNRAEIQGLRLVQAGTVVSIQELEASYSGWALLTRRAIDLSSARVTGVVVDLRTATPASETASAPAHPPSAAPAPGDSSASAPATKVPAPAAAAVPREFQGIFAQFQPPLPVSVRRATIEGRVLLPAERTVNFVAEVSGIAPGATGTVTASIDLTDTSPAAHLRAARLRASAALRSTSEGRFDQLEATVTLAGEGPAIPPDTIQLRLDGAPATEGGGEAFNLRVGLARTTATLPLLTASARYRPTDRSLSGSWELTAGSGELRDVLAALRLPDLQASGRGAWFSSPDTGALSADGTLELKARDLGVLAPALAGTGQVAARTAFDVRLANQVLRLERLTLAAGDPTAQPIVDLAALQPLSLDLRTRRPTFSRPEAPLARISVRALPLAWFQPLVGPTEIVSGNLSLALSIEASPDGSRASARTTEPLSITALTVRRDGRTLVEKATLQASPRIDYTPDSLSAGLERLVVSLPAGDRIEGSVSAVAGSLASPLPARVSVKLDGRGIIAHAAVSPLATGPLDFGLGLTGEIGESRLQLESADLRVARSGDGPLAEIGLRQALTYDLAAGRPSVGAPDRPLARVTLGSIPASWFQPFLTDSRADGALSGGVLEAYLRGPDEVAVATAQPLALRGLGFALQGRTLASGLDGSIAFGATWRGGVLTYDLQRFELTQDATSVARLQAKGVARFGPTFSVTAAGSVDADLPTLLRQPALTGSVALRQGSARLDFDVALADGIRGNVALNARDLTPADPAAPKGALTVSADVALDAAGAGTIRVPLLLEVAGRKSDLTLDARLTKRGEGLELQGSLAGAQLIVNDLVTLAALAPESPSPKPATPGRSSGPARDAAPFWNGVTGRLDVDLKRVLYGEDYPINDVRGALVVSEDRITLEGKEGRLKESPFALAGTLAFDAAQARPYALSGRTTIAEVDVGALLRAANPKEKPSIETRASLAARFAGTGATPGGLLAGLTGEVDLTGNQGILRALGRRGQTIGTASALVGLVGALRGSDTTVAVAELASALNELRFDRFKIRVERGADMNLNVSSIEFLSPTARITGSGAIQYRTGVPLLDQALRFDLQLAGKDSLALVLQRAGVLGGEPDAQGFYAMTSKIALGGTPANPDASQFWRLIGQAALGGLLR